MKRSDGLEPAMEGGLDTPDAQVREFMDNLDAVFWMMTYPPKRVLYASAAFEAIFGIGRDAIMDDVGALAACFHPEDRRRAFDADDDAWLRSSEPARLRLIWPDGRLRWIETRTFLIVGPDGSPERIAGFTRDVTTEVESQAKLIESYEWLRRADGERRRLLARLVEAQEEERGRISREVHDDAIQVMTAVGIKLHLLALTASPDIAPIARDAMAAVEEAIAHLRSLMFDLRPAGLDRDTIAGVIRRYLTEATANAIRWEVDDRLSSEPTPEIARVLYRIIQEAVINTRKHARASTIRIALEGGAAGVKATVSDDGDGFDPGEGSGHPGHLGLTAMRERAEIAGGSLRLLSAPGWGTSVSCWLPANGRATAAKDAAQAD